MNDWGLPEINMCDFGFIYLLNSFCTFCEYFSFSINRPNFDLCSWVSRVPAFPRVDKQNSVWCTVHTLYSAMKCSPMQNVIMGNSHSLNHGSKPSILQWSEYYTFDRGTISSFELPLSKKKKETCYDFSLMTIASKTIFKLCWGFQQSECMSQHWLLIRWIKIYLHSFPASDFLAVLSPAYLQTAHALWETEMP